MWKVSHRHFHFHTHFNLFDLLRLPMFLLYRQVNVSIFARACNGSAYTMNLNPKKQIKTSEPWEFFHICQLPSPIFLYFLTSLLLTGGFRRAQHWSADHIAAAICLNIYRYPKLWMLPSVPTSTHTHRMLTSLGSFLILYKLKQTGIWWGVFVKQLLIKEETLSAALSGFSGKAE